MLESFFVDREPRRRLRVTIAVAAFVHAAGISAAIVASIWSVNKLTPKYVAVTWQPTAAPPPPPPPAAAPSPPAPVTPSAPATARGPLKPDVPVTTASPLSTNTGTGDPNAPTGTGEGIQTGIPDGTGDPVPEPPPAPPATIDIRTLTALRISGDSMIRLPPHVLRALADQGVRRVDVPVRLCLSTDGVPTQIELGRSTGNSQGDDHIRDSVRTWRYRPYQVNGRAVPACGVVLLQYQID
jgi:hypothetical protein